MTEEISLPDGFPDPKGREDNGVPYETRSVKDCLVQVVKADYNVEHKFILRSEDVNSWLSRVRTELSRLRSKVKGAGRKPLRFKILDSGREITHDGKAVTITLVKSEGNAKVYKAIEALFENLT